MKGLVLKKRKHSAAAAVKELMFPEVMAF